MLFIVNRLIPNSIIRIAQNRTRRQALATVASVTDSRIPFPTSRSNRNHVSDDLTASGEPVTALILTVSRSHLSGFGIA
ncbi:hypothetical protein L6452_04726 [Arctium lappa]|uniref:Uncharacterized protein n=1 Tax=Arctium lappa TaxID=4217 RepID=A0ACB9EEF9_ARCLA|nr:hypothetical protein L6452_04726 [Arctium lappa]